jgi:hypothetical protein
VKRSGDVNSEISQTSAYALLSIIPDARSIVACVAQSNEITASELGFETRSVSVVLLELRAEVDAGDHERLHRTAQFAQREHVCVGSTEALWSWASRSSQSGRRNARISAGAWPVP